jgi:hypothetical protein
LKSILVRQRNHVEEISHGEWEDGIEECRKNEIAILAEDIPGTIAFLKNECTSDEYVWISEVFEDVVNMVPSKELVQCYKELMVKFPEACSEYHIETCIENAEAILKWEEEHEKEG